MFYLRRNSIAGPLLVPWGLSLTHVIRRLPMLTATGVFFLLTYHFLQAAILTEATAMVAPGPPPALILMVVTPLMTLTLVHIRLNMARLFIRC